MKILTIAHRGASAVRPENTLAAFRKALEIGADLIELDVRFSRDGSVIVFHDRRLERTTDGRGPVNALTLRQLRQLDAGSWFSPEFKGEMIPTLEEVIALVSPGKIKLCIEIKIDRGAEKIREELVGNVINIIRSSGFQTRSLPSSFDKACLPLVKKLMPGLPCGLIFSEEKIWEEVDASNFAQTDYLSARWNIVTAERVRRAHRAGRRVIAWTIDGEKELEKMIQCGVDVIASNDPRWLIENLRERGY